MNKLLATLAITTALSFTAQADEAVDLCVTYSDAAESVMTARQNNMSVAELYKVAEDNKLFIALIKEAYARPSYSAEANKKRSIDTFKNDVFLVCINGLEGGEEI